MRNVEEIPLQVFLRSGNSPFHEEVRNTQHKAHVKENDGYNEN